MGSPVSPIVANPYIEEFEDRAIITAVNPPGYGRDMLMTLNLEAILLSIFHPILLHY